MPSFRSYFYRVWNREPDGVAPATPSQRLREMALESQRDLQRAIDRHRTQMIYGVPFVETRAGGVVRPGDMVVTDEHASVRITDVEEAPYDLCFTGTRRFTHPDVQPARPLYFDFGYQIGQYGDETHERVPRIKKRRVRVWPPRRGFDRRLKDWPEHFVDEEYTDEDDWEVIPKQFNIPLTQAQTRMYERRQTIMRNQQFREAHRKSFELLKEWLTEDEYHSLTVKHELNIISGKYLFTISDDPGNTIHITDAETGYNLGNYCLVCRDYRYPDGDTLLTKIMLIKTDPESFISIGCN